ncbi:sensor domain-containing protein [Noviherbaspirillum galbum]|uniref:EAL domain-containing protein n=1 Tax=Noviherbaspirillum galbum TaxID=2709383 RepID=A0A6B3SIU6_9BURK|nr:EAL domain-containing protein [Noviherbaspirillum galbum]NEX60508.1 EAL domain-containing protein [Noviherbaspirillum galbum]
MSRDRTTAHSIQPPSFPIAAGEESIESERAQQLFDALPEPLAVCARDGMLHYANPPFVELMTAGAGQDIGSQLTALVHQDDHDALLAALESGMNTRIAFRVRRRDGRWRQVEGRCGVLPGAEGAAVLILHDVTEEREALAGVESDNRRQLHYLNRLLHLARRPPSHFESDLKLVLKCLTKALGAQHCAYWEVGDDPLLTRCVLAYDDVQQNLLGGPELESIESLHALLADVARDGKALVADNVDMQPRTALAFEYFHAMAIKAAVLHPLEPESGTAAAGGVLILSGMHQARHWRKDEVDLVEQAAAMLASSMARSQRPRNDNRHGAHRDRLTGLPNRHFLLDHAGDLFPRVSNSSHALAAFLVDVDGFRKVNESHGHAVGDELLQAIALRLKHIVRKDDMLVRMGNDQFMLLARNLGDMRVADDIGQEIVDTLQDAFALQGGSVNITASVGVALYPLDGNDFDTLHKHAQIAMANAKSGGRNRYRMYSPRLAHRVEGKSVADSELRRAIRESELQHYYQPQIDLRTGQIRCVEALLRWRHPVHGMMLPAGFLPLAEESGLMPNITSWVVREACAQLRRWKEAGHELVMAVNLSTTQMIDKALIATLEDALERNNLAGTQLELEISESTAMRQDAMSTALLARIADMRIGLSIDDFGTGYSNMAYLRRYPVHKVKIDRSLVDGLPAAGDESAVTDAIISMAQALGLEVVAEGVESQAQLDYLRSHGCGIAQGYYFTQPLSEEQFNPWLIRH